MSNSRGTGELASGSGGAVGIGSRGAKKAVQPIPCTSTAAQSTNLRLRPQLQAMATSSESCFIGFLPRSGAIASTLYPNLGSLPTESIPAVQSLLSALPAPNFGLARKNHLFGTTGEIVTTRNWKTGSAG